MPRPIYPLCCSALLLPIAAWSAESGRVTRDEVIVTGYRESEYANPQTQTATRMDLSVLETPQSVSTLTRALLDDYALTDLNLALEHATGVTVEQVETDRTYYIARGFDITNFQVDGVGVPLTYGNIDGDFDTSIYERVEIVRGATSLMAGAGNPSATINLIRKRPTATLTGDTTLQYGSWDSMRVEADVGGPISKRVRARLVAVEHTQDSYLRDYAKDRSAYHGVLEFDVSENVVASIGYTDQRSHADRPMWGAIPLYLSDGSQAEYDDSLSTAADWSWWNTDQSNAFADVTLTLGDGWNVRGAYSYTEVEGDSELFYMFGAVDPVTYSGLTGWASAYNSKERRQLADLYATRTFKLGGRDHQLVIGGNWSQTNFRDLSLYDYTTGAGFPDVGDIREWHGDAAHPVFADQPEGSEFVDRQTGWYFAGRASVTDALGLVAGARLLSWESHGVSYEESQKARVRDELLPYYGVTYSLRDNVVLYGSHTKSFMPQSEIDESFDRLDPARGTNTEFGLKASFNKDRLTATVAWFEADHQNVAEYAGFVEGLSVYEGLDFESTGYELDVAGAIGAGLQVNLGYTWLQIDDATGQRARPYVPGHLVRLATSYTPAWFDRLRVGASVNWQDDTSTSDLNYAQGIVRQDSYALVSLFADLQLTQRLAARLVVNNVTDEKYIQSLYWDQAYYGAPLNALLSVNVRL